MSKTKKSLKITHLPTQNGKEEEEEEEEEEKTEK
jgi:hypothetical protein